MAKIPKKIIQLLKQADMSKKLDANKSAILQDDDRFSKLMNKLDTSLLEGYQNLTDKERKFIDTRDITKSVKYPLDMLNNETKSELYDTIATIEKRVFDFEGERLAKLTEGEFGKKERSASRILGVEQYFKNQIRGENQYILDTLSTGFGYDDDEFQEFATLFHEADIEVQLAFFQEYKPVLKDKYKKFGQYIAEERKALVKEYKDFLKQAKNPDFLQQTEEYRNK